MVRDDDDPLPFGWSIGIIIFWVVCGIVVVGLLLSTLEGS